MKQDYAKVLLAIGVLILLMGLAMPSTETKSSRSCVNDPYGYGDTCSETTYEAPNSSKGPAIFFGIVLSLIGGISVKNGSSNSSTDGDAGNQNGGNGSDQPKTLVEQVEERQSELEEDGSADPGRTE